MNQLDFGIQAPQDFSPLSEGIIEETLLPQFERIAQQYAEKVAVREDGETLTYRQLNIACSHLADQVIHANIIGKSPVAFLFSREIKSIIALIALLKANHPSLGLHPSNSLEQMTAFLENAGAQLLITSSEFRQTADHLDRLIPGLRVIYFEEIVTEGSYPNPGIPILPDDTFGIVYTSGSTGEPKGVAIGHMYKSQSILYQTNGWKFSPGDRVTLLTSVCYLASHPSLFGALLNGGTLHIFDLKNNSAQKALDWMVEERLSVFRSTPTIFRTIFRLAPDDLIFKDLRFITLGGEPVTRSDIDLFKQHTTRDCVLINNYACTEAGGICHYPVTHQTRLEDESLPAGYPAPGKEVILVDDHGDPVGPGETGEVIVRSKYMNPGYWRMPELTAHKYSTDPHNPEYQFYFTGDLGRFRDDGVLEIKGRKDSQVKIRGFRVHLDAIDLALRELPAVLDAATIVYGDKASGEKLASYLVMEHNQDLPVTQFRAALAEKLPDFMLPATFIKVEALPRSSTGKLSRKDLPDPIRERPNIETPYRPPQPGIQTEIAAIWQEVLGIDQVGVEDNFFALGGDSLLALKMTLDVEKALKKEFPQQFFENPTISTLCEIVNSGMEKNRNRQSTSFQSVTHVPSPQRRSRKTENRLIKLGKKVVRRKYSTSDFGRLHRFTENLVASRLVTKPIREAQASAVRWSKNKAILDVFYRKRQRLFLQWLEVLGIKTENPSDLFSMSFLNNIYFRLPRPGSNRQEDADQDNGTYQISRYPLWKSIGEILDNRSLETMQEFFPIVGLEFLQKEYERGKGAILVSFHGTPRAGGLLPISKLLGIETIPTISYQIPLRQSRYSQNKRMRTDLEAAAMNAEIALYGQQLLQSGRVINFNSDTSDTTGAVFHRSIANRTYQLKSGFAEMALNTGAPIVPYTRYCLPDGRIQMELFPAFEVTSSNRQAQVEHLLNDYAKFIEDRWLAHPEALSWTRIERHLDRDQG